MRTPSLNKLYFESLSLPSSPFVWIGCSLALHLGVWLLPLGGTSHQEIVFAPGDAGVQVELVAGDTEIPAPQPETPNEPAVEPPMPIAQIPLPEENEVVIAEPETKPVVRKISPEKSHTVARNNSKPNESLANKAGAAPAGSAIAQPAAQVYTPQPPYPQAAREAGVEGKVRLRVRVGTNGCARAVEIARSGGRSDFDTNSLNTVTRDWRFRPARTVGGAPVETTITVAIHFNLRS